MPKLMPISQVLRCWFLVGQSYMVIYGIEYQVIALNLLFPAMLVLFKLVGTTLGS
jgi:hypothetical protein